MSKSLEEIVADVACAGASGTVGLETAKRIVAAIEASKKVPDKPEVSPPDLPRVWEPAPKMTKKEPEPKFGKKKSSYYE